MLYRTNFKEIKNYLSRNNTNKKYLNKKTPNASVYACYSAGLIIKQIYKYLKTKNLTLFFLELFDST